MNKMRDGQKDALSGLIDEETDTFEATAPFLRRIDQIGGLYSLHVVGTFANTPGSWFYESGPWTTFIYAEFENWNQYWNLVWNENETYASDLQGPWPSFTLIPVHEERYVGVSREGNWKTVNLGFKNGCVEVGAELVCKSEVRE